jgi:hypothetical protein
MVKSREKTERRHPFPSQHENAMAAAFVVSILASEEGCQEAHSKDADQRKKYSKDKPIARTVPPAGLCHEDYSREQEQNEGESAMESADL